MRLLCVVERNCVMKTKKIIYFIVNSTFAFDESRARLFV